MIKCDHFTDDTINHFLHRSGNRITFSRLLDCELEEYNAETYSIKYVMRGTEHYFINSKKFSVSAGNYLLVNSHQPLDVFVKSRQKVLGVCIHIEKAVMQDMYSDFYNSGNINLDDPFSIQQVPEFEQIIYSDKENGLGKSLQQIAQTLARDGDFMPFDVDGFYGQLSGNIYRSQSHYLKKSRSVIALKHSTNEELLRRLNLAKELMTDAPGLMPIDKIAQHSMLSNSHFFRSFRKIYGLSPYQYLLQQKLLRSKKSLECGTESITDIALSNGFSDLASFSKAFKKQFGTSPSRFFRS